jgi:tetratricopeptide (TPR) repeat protein
LETWLEQQPVGRLRDLLVDQARRDPEVHRRLTMLAAVEDGGPINPAGYQAAITEALATATFDDYGFVHYDEAGAWRERVEAVLDDLDSLLEAGFAAETVGLAEDVLRKLNDSVGSIDDSDGHLYEVLERTMGVHLAACYAARPDPVALGERLFDWAYRWELDGFLTAVRRYEPVLGTDGLAAYRRLAEERWRTVPALGPDDDRSSRFGERFRITRIMETLAETTGGIEALLDVMRRDQTSGSAFLRLAKACRRHERDDLALEWALRGLELFPGELRLAELICDLHTEAGRNDEALAVGRAMFGRAPALERYQHLRALAESADAWPAERDPALASVRSGIEERRRGSAPQRSRHGADGSVLVEILLWEQDGEAAWEAAATYGCDQKLELHLAAVRGQEHPAEALEVYRRHLEAALQPANNRAYDQVAQLLEAMGPLYVALGEVDDFDALVAEIRTTYKRRPNLMRCLDRARL